MAPKKSTDKTTDNTPKPRNKRATKASSVIPQDATPEKETAEPTKSSPPVNITVSTAQSANFKLYLILAGICLVVFLFVYFKYRNNSPNAIVEKNDKLLAPINDSLKVKQVQYDSLVLKAYQDSVKQAYEDNYVKQIEAENASLMQRIREREEHEIRHLQNQKIQNDATNKIIKNPAPKQLDSLLNDFKRAERMLD